MPAKNKYVEAFKENFNTIPFATAVAVSVAFGNPLPLLGALVAEAAYLLFLPDSKWYDRRLSERYDQEVVERREKLKAEVFPSLSNSVQLRFNRLETVRNQISAQTFDGKRWFREVLRKLDYLMEKFLLFATKQVQFENYLRSVLDEVEQNTNSTLEFRDERGVKKRLPPIPVLNDEGTKKIVERIQESYGKEIEAIDQNMMSDGNLHNQAVLDKRKEILMRRQQYVGRIGEILTNLSHQLSLMEDTFGLINDEIRARSPEQVLADIEDVVFQSDNLAETLQEVAPFEQMDLAKGASKLYDAR